MRIIAVVAIGVRLMVSESAVADIRQNVEPLIQSSCLHCHDSETETGLNFESIAGDLTDDESFRMWEKIFDRVHDGEMPPESEDRPDPKQLEAALAALKADLLGASREKQERVGRVPARRLTKLEIRYTLQDLLLIESDVTVGIPDEIESGNFDTVGSSQRLSALHMESYLQAADEAIRLAINLGRNPYRTGENDYTFLDEWHEKPLNLGGSITRRLKFGDGVVLFRDVDYLTQFQFGVSVPGIHRLVAEVAAYQSKRPLTAKLIVKDQTGGARLVKSVDLQSGEPTRMVVETFLKPGDTPYLTFDMEGDEPFNAIVAAGGSKHYRGRGLAILSQRVEGPLFDSWPPPSTRQLLHGLELSASDESEEGPFRIQQSQDDLDHVTEITHELATRVFRRPVDQTELLPFIDLARPAIEEERDLIDVLSVPLRSMLSSPQFLFFGGQPGELNDYDLATRLSFFLWRSMPDDVLFELAGEGRLSDTKVLAAQVDRMLADPKSLRFVQDFLGQWLRLYKVHATTPDDGLYPEYDELLADAISKEPELFFAALIRENRGLTNLIDSDFTFVNRRLAEHYGIGGVEGQQFRKVSLPADSPRGGILTQAAVLKTTANGTTTSPVTRGNFVLTNFLGTPPSPPPPGIGSIEPDTRGKTTIREILASHRETDSCNACHREIDPPGFALESFDPIGGFRTRYRVSGGEQRFGDFTAKLPPKPGPVVDSSGVTSDGKPFSGIEEFKRCLLDQTDQIARNFVSQLAIFATGGEIQFADRELVEGIVKRSRENGFPVRDIIHEIVQSRLFRHK